MVGKALWPEDDRSQQSWIAQDEPEPGQPTEGDREGDLEPSAPGADVDRHCAAEERSQQERADDGGLRQGVQRRAGEQYRANASDGAGSEPTRSQASSTGTTLATFVPPSKTRNNTTNPLTTHPARSIVMDGDHDGSGPVGIVQKRQLLLAAHELARRLSDESLERADEMRLIEVSGVVHHVGDGSPVPQQVGGTTGALDLADRGTGHSGRPEDAPLLGP